MTRESRQRTRRQFIQCRIILGVRNSCQRRENKSSTSHGIRHRLTSSIAKANTNDKPIILSAAFSLLLARMTAHNILINECTPALHCTDGSTAVRSFCMRVPRAASSFLSPAAPQHILWTLFCTILFVSSVRTSLVAIMSS